MQHIPGIEPTSPVVEVWNLNHWTARKVPPRLFLIRSINIGQQRYIKILFSLKISDLDHFGMIPMNVLTMVSPNQRIKCRFSRVKDWIFSRQIINVFLSFSMHMKVIQEHRTGACILLKLMSNRVFKGSWRLSKLGEKNCQEEVTDLFNIPGEFNKQVPEPVHL